MSPSLEILSLIWEILSPIVETLLADVEMLSPVLERYCLFFGRYCLLFGRYFLLILERRYLLNEENSSYSGGEICSTPVYSSSILVYVKAVVRVKTKKR